MSLLIPRCLVDDLRDACPAGRYGKDQTGIRMRPTGRRQRTSIQGIKPANILHFAILQRMRIRIGRKAQTIDGDLQMKLCQDVSMGGDQLSARVTPVVGVSIEVEGLKKRAECQRMPGESSA